MLNNSTEVTTDSFRIQAVETSCNNITDYYVEPCLSNLDANSINSSLSSSTDSTNSLPSIIIPSAPPLSPEIPTALACTIPVNKNYN